MHSQQGIGMVEVMVALLLLANAVLGFSFLQMRAVDASTEAMSKLQATNLARDLSERIRANAQAYTVYLQAVNLDQASQQAKNCVQTNTETPCSTAQQLALFDVSEIKQLAQRQGMQIRMPLCHTSGNQSARNCIYVAWGETQAIDDDSSKLACTRNGSYLPRAQCVVMELY